MRNIIKDFLTYNRREQRGILMLLGILILLILVRSFLPYFFPPKKYDISGFKKEIDVFIAKDSLLEDRKVKSYASSSYDSLTSVKSNDIQLFCFDPNGLPSEKWKELGLNEKVIRTIKNFESKGGKFRQNEDLKKIYGLSPEDYNRLEPFLRIPEVNKPSTSNRYPDSTTKGPRRIYTYANQILIDINSADTADLMKCKGIGTYTAQKIISYRQRLGGFVAKEQLKEIKGLDSSRYEQLRDQIVIGTTDIKKLDLNTATFKEMRAHPYFEYYLVKEIFHYRDVNGRFDSVAELKKIPVIYKELYERIAPYLKTD